MHFLQLQISANYSPFWVCSFYLITGCAGQFSGGDEVKVYNYQKCISFSCSTQAKFRSSWQLSNLLYQMMVIAKVEHTLYKITPKSNIAMT